MEATQHLAPVWAGLEGRVRLFVGESPAGVLVLRDDHVALIADDGPVDATLHFATRADAVAMLQGRINPVVATLRRSARLGGDRRFAARIILGLRAAGPYLHVSEDHWPPG